MGIAIMGGVMATLAETRVKTALGTSDSDSDSKPTPSRLPSRFVACDTWAGSEPRVKAALAHYNFPLTTLTNQNVQGAHEADIVLLSCKPQGYKDILGEPGMREALEGKILVSILAGVTQKQLEEALYPGGSLPRNACRLVRVMPNTASFVRESMSVIQTSEPALSEEQQRLVEWVFSSIGKVVTLPPHLDRKSVV